MFSSGCMYGHGCCCRGDCSWDRPCSCHCGRDRRFYWVRGQGHHVPNGAVHAGEDREGRPFYAGRAFHEGDFLPAKIVPRYKAAYITFAGVEHSKFEFEVLCSNNVAWTEAAFGEVPMNAVPVGRTRDGEPLYLGRVRHDGTLTPGKIHPSHRVIYIPYFGSELRFDRYEALVAV